LLFLLFFFPSATTTSSTFFSASIGTSAFFPETVSTSFLTSASAGVLPSSFSVRFLLLFLLFLPLLFFSSTACLSYDPLETWISSIFFVLPSVCGFREKGTVES